MIFIKIFRFFFGSVTFSAKGGFRERFINLCAMRKIDIRDVQNSHDGITAVVKAGSYGKIRSIAHLSGMKIRAEKKSGLPFLIKRYKNRVGLVIGAVFFAAFLSISSMFIWSVEVIGDDNVNAAEILNAVEDLGVREGALKKSIDTYEVARRSMVTLTGKVSWLAVNIKGTHAVIEVRDYIAWRDDETYSEPCNIVADFSGLLLSLEVYNGIGADAVGSGVDKGDLLISGIVENRDTSSQFLEARGKITALHTVNTVMQTKSNDTVKKYISEKSIKKIKLFSFEIPLGIFRKEKESFDEFEDEKKLSFGKTELPFAVKTVSRYYYTEAAADNKSIDIKAFDNFTYMCYNKFANTLVLSEDITVTDEKNGVKITAKSECIDFMGKKQKIFVE